MRWPIFALFAFVFLSSCIHRETYQIERPPGVLKAKYSATFLDQPIGVHVTFPENSRPKEVVKLQIEYDSKAKTIGVGVNEASGYLVEAISSSRSLENDWTLFVLLKENEARLMPHQASHQRSFEPSEVFSSIGRLVIETDKTVSMCNGFLVRDNLAVTAHHCIATREDCRNTSFVAWTTKGELLTSACSEILETDERVDQTLFRMEKTVDSKKYKNLAIFPFRRSFPVDLPVHLASDITPWDQIIKTPKRFAELSKKIIAPCSVERVSNFLQMDGGKSWKFSLHYTGCTVERGQSGSAVLDNDGRLIGVVNMKVDDERGQAIFSPLSAKILERLRQ